MFSLKKPKSDKENSQKSNFENPGKDPEIPPPENPPLPKENDNCPYLNEVNLTTPSDKCDGILKMVLDKGDIAKWKKIPTSYVVNCWNKGYHWHDILQLWGWKIAEAEIPNLKSEKRMGVINSLYYLTGLPVSTLYNKSITKEEMLKMHEDESMSGLVRNSVFIIRKKPNDEPAINLDKNIYSMGKGDPFGNTVKYVKNLIVYFCQTEKIDLNQYQVSFLNCLGAEYFQKEGDIKHGISMGKSIGTSIYLTALSAWHKKPIAKKIASTGHIITKSKKAQYNSKEIDLNSGTVLPISGLKGKVIGATKKGINCLVFSKFQTTPYISLWNKEGQKWIELNEDDYQKKVPAEIKSKIKEIHWTENIQELKDLILQGKLE